MHAKGTYPGGRRSRLSRSLGGHIPGLQADGPNEPVDFGPLDGSPLIAVDQASSVAGVGVPGPEADALGAQREVQQHVTCCCTGLRKPCRPDAAAVSKVVSLLAHRHTGAVF